MNKFSKGMAIVGVCALGMGCMWLTKGETGIGWAVLGTLLICEGF